MHDAKEQLSMLLAQERQWEALQAPDKQVWACSSISACPPVDVYSNHGQRFALPTVRNALQSCLTVSTVSFCSPAGR